MRDYSVGIFDRLVSFLSYITAGWGGMIALVVLYIRKKNPSRFLRYNAFQSIFISLMFFIISYGLELILKMLSYVPFLNYIVAFISLQFTKPVFFQYSLGQVFIIGLTLYMAIFALLGKYPRVYWVSSKIIDRQVR